MTRKKSIISPQMIIIFILVILVINTLFARSSDASVSVSVDQEEDAYVITVLRDEENNTKWEYLDADVTPFIKDGVTLVPLRALSERFGYIVEYQDNEKKIIINDSEEKNAIILNIDSKKVLINGRESFMLEYPVVRNNRVLVPLRYVSEFFGYNVYWERHPISGFIGVWISCASLLSDDDVYPSKKDYDTLTDGYVTYYSLKDTGMTSKGIRIGDTIDKIIEAYGVPHKIEYNHYDKMNEYYYSTVQYPDKNDGMYISFWLKNGRVIKSYIYNGV